MVGIGTVVEQAKAPQDNGLNKDYNPREAPGVATALWAVGDWVNLLGQRHPMGGHPPDGP